MSDTLPPPTPGDVTPVRAGPPPAPPVVEPIAYRPLSGFAVAGAAMGGLFAVLVLSAAIVGLYQGAPFFYALWIVLLPGAGLVLSLVARSRIRASEGTQAGEALAGWGIWTSLLFGLGYFVYFQVTGHAVTRQADAFLMELGPDSGFLPHLQKAATSRTDFNAAFLLTLPPTARTNARPEDDAAMVRSYGAGGPDGAPGKLQIFRTHPLVSMVSVPDPKQVQFESLGVQGWDYEEHSYKVRRIYRVITPEATIELVLPISSAEGETAGEPRRWWVPLLYVGRPNDKQIKRTPLGDGLRVVRLNTQNTLLRWKQALNDGQPFSFATIDGTPWETLLGLSDVQKGALRARLQDLFSATARHRLMTLSYRFEEEDLGGWAITEDKKVQMTHGARMMVENPGKEEKYYVDAAIVVETNDAIDPAALAGAPREIGCTVRKFTVTRAGIMAKKMPAL